MDKKLKKKKNEAKEIEKELKYNRDQIKRLQKQVEQELKKLAENTQFFFSKILKKKKLNN